MSGGTRGNRVVAFLCVFALVSLLVGCAGKPEASPPATGKTEEAAQQQSVTIRWSDRLTPQGILFKGGGYPEKYGLKLDSKLFPTGTEIRDALISGDLDIGELGITPMLTGLVRAPGKLFAVGVSSFGGGKYSVVVRKDSAYQNMKDLVGKKLAVKVGSGCYTAFLLWAKGQGLTEKDFQILDMGDVDAMAALETKSVDAVVYWEPIPSLLIAKGLAREIFNFKGLVNNPVYLVARREFADANPDAVARFLAAYADMDQMLTFDIPKAAEVSARELSKHGINVPAEAYAIALGKETYEIWIYPELIEETVELFKTLQQEGKIPADARVNWDEVFRAEFPARAHEILVRQSLPR